MIGTRKRSAMLISPFNSEFAKYFQGALWTYIAAAALITIAHNINW